MEDEENNPRRERESSSPREAEEKPLRDDHAVEPGFGEEGTSEVAFHVPRD